MTPAEPPGPSQDPIREIDGACHKCEFLLEEYEALRKETELYITETRAVERYTIIAIGAVWAWLSANRIEHLVAWMIPLILTIGVGLRDLTVVLHFNGLNKYICRTGAAFRVKGWEHEPCWRYPSFRSPTFQPQTVINRI